MKNLLLLTLSFLITSFAFANDDFEIQLKSGKFTPEVTTDFEKAIQPLFAEKNQTSVYRIIQFYSIPTNKEKQAIANAGLELINYIPNKAFICKVANNASISDFEKLRIRSILSIESSFKIAKSLTQKELPEWALNGDEILLNVKYYSAIDRLAVVNSIEESDGEILECVENINVLTIQYASDKINDLAENPLIQWVCPVSPPSTPESNERKNTTRSNGLNTFYNGGRKYDGSGISVVLSDDGAVGPHIDFEGRATMHTTLNQGNHGDMTSGILVGAGNLDPTIVGMAPAAEIHIFRIGRFIFLSSQEYILNAIDNLNNLGAVITSTSYRCSSTADYPTDLDDSGGHTSATQHNAAGEYHYHIQNELYLNQYYILFPDDYKGTPGTIR